MAGQKHKTDRSVNLEDKDAERTAVERHWKGFFSFSSLVDSFFFLTHHPRVLPREVASGYPLYFYKASLCLAK